MKCVGDIDVLLADQVVSTCNIASDVCAKVATFKAELCVL
jgi:hypothetical protein